MGRVLGALPVAPSPVWLNPELHISLSSEPVGGSDLSLSSQLPSLPSLFLSLFTRTYQAFPYDMSISMCDIFKNLLYQTKLNKMLFRGWHGGTVC